MYVYIKLYIYVIHNIYVLYEIYYKAHLFSVIQQKIEFLVVLVVHQA